MYKLDLRVIRFYWICSTISGYLIFFYIFYSNYSIGGFISAIIIATFSTLGKTHFQDLYKAAKEIDSEQVMITFSAMDDESDG